MKFIYGHLMDYNRKTVIKEIKKAFEELDTKNMSTEDIAVWGGLTAYFPPNKGLEILSRLVYNVLIPAGLILMVIYVWL